MSDRNETDNIIKFQRKFQVNIGFFLMAIIFLYIAFHIFTSITEKNITIYEVLEGTIAANNSYQALAIRQETIVNADTGGYIYYYGRNKSRVGMRSPVYAIDTNGALAAKMNATSESDIVLGAHDLRMVSADVDTFIHDYNSVNFHNVYSFKSNLEETLTDLYSQQLQSEYSNEINDASGADTFIKFNALTPGLLCYVIDGYEGMSLESFDSGSFDKGSLEYTNLRLNESVDAGAPVYKLVTSDDWNLVMPIEKDIAESLAEAGSIQIRFLADNAKTWARSEVIDKAGEKYLVLSLDDSMERYADQRFVGVELLLDSESGLKIPNTAIVEKEFFTIPKEYFMQGADNNAVGLMIKRESEDVFVNPTVYYETETEYYIDNEYVNADDKVIKADSKNTYTVGQKTDKLPGVYSVNKGYTIFKRIEIVYQNEDYAVVRTGTDYGIAMYDYIVLQSDSVTENEVIN